jgi:hypothetical protein
MPLSSPLDLDNAADAKNVLTGQAHRTISNRETDWTEVVVNLRYHRYEILRNLGTNILGNTPGQESVGT